MNYATGIRKAREKAGLSKLKLARLAGFNASYIGLLESGKRVPSLEALETIAAVTDVPTALLMLMCAEDRDLKGIDAQNALKLSEALSALMRGLDERR